jgi:putative phage-type endonuclease
MSQQLSDLGIGASEISAVVGLNPYASPWDVWLRKTGQAPEFQTTEPIEWGHRLEPAIRQAYADKTGAAIHVPLASIFHKTTPWARATPDGIVIQGGQWQHLVQCKNVGTWVEKAWKDAPPAYVQLQEQWEMYVTDLARADVAVLIGGNGFRIYTVHRDDKMIGDLVSIASEFWQRVETRTAPPIDASDACREHFERKLSKGSAVELEADPQLAERIAEWQRLHSEGKRITTEIERIKNEVRAAMADAQAERVQSPYGAPCLQKRGGTSSTDWKLVAELLGSTKCSEDEYRALVASNTNEKPASLTLVPPKSWAKEAI